MRNKKILFGICAAVLTILSITGCSDTSSKEENSTQIVKVTQVDGNTITAQTGTLKESTDGMPGNQKPDGTPPAKPGDSDNRENQKEENANPPQGEPPQNDSSQGQPPQGDAPQNDSSHFQESFFIIDEHIFAFSCKLILQFRLDIFVKCQINRSSCYFGKWIFRRSATFLFSVFHFENLLYFYFGVSRFLQRS